MNELGSDFGGGADLSASLAEQRGRPALADAIMRRLTTERGGLPDYPDYGFDISSLIGTIIEPSSVAQRVLAQVRAEQEVDRASLDIETSSDNTEITLKLKIVSGQGPWPLTIQVSDLGVTAIIPGQN